MKSDFYAILHRISYKSFFGLPVLKVRFRAPLTKAYLRSYHHEGHQCHGHGEGHHGLGESFGFEVVKVCPSVRFALSKRARAASVWCEAKYKFSTQFPTAKCGSPWLVQNKTNSDHAIYDSSNDSDSNKYYYAQALALARSRRRRRQRREARKAVTAAAPRCHRPRHRRRRRRCRHRCRCGVARENPSLPFVVVVVTAAAAVDRSNFLQAARSAGLSQTDRQTQSVSVILSIRRTHGHGRAVPLLGLGTWRECCKEELRSEPD